MYTFSLSSPCGFPLDSQFFAELFDAPEFEREFLEQSIPRGNHNSPLATLPRRPMIHYEANSASVDISPKRIKLPALVGCRAD